MPSKVLYIVQQFERQGKKLVAGRALEMASAEAAVLRAERAATTAVGVVALTQTIDTDTGEVLEEPVVLVRHGELPREFSSDEA